MHAAHPTRSVCPLPLPDDRMGRLQRQVRIAEHGLAHVTQAVLDMVRGCGTVLDEAHAEGLETVHLVDHGDDEGAVVWAEVDEALRGRVEL